MSTYFTEMFWWREDCRKRKSDGERSKLRWETLISQMRPSAGENIYIFPMTCTGRNAAKISQGPAETH